MTAPLCLRPSLQKESPGSPGETGVVETLRRQLLRGVVAGKVDLGNWITIDSYMIGELGTSADDLNCLTDDDLDEVRRRLQRRGSLLDHFDAVAETIDESGVGSLALAAAIIVGVLVLGRLIQGSAHAATPEALGPESSNIAGLIVALAPCVIAVAFLACATRGAPQPADDEAFGDTTGFEERER